MLRLPLNLCPKPILDNLNILLPRCLEMFDELKKSYAGTVFSCFNVPWRLLSITRHSVLLIMINIVVIIFNLQGVPKSVCLVFLNYFQR